MMIITSTCFVVCQCLLRMSCHPQMWRRWVDPAQMVMMWIWNVCMALIARTLTSPRNCGTFFEVCYMFGFVPHGHVLLAGTWVAIFPGKLDKCYVWQFNDWQAHQTYAFIAAIVKPLFLFLCVNSLSRLPWKTGCKLCVYVCQLLFICRSLNFNCKFRLFCSATSHTVFRIVNNWNSLQALAICVDNVNTSIRQKFCRYSWKSNFFAL